MDGIQLSIERGSLLRGRIRRLQHGDPLRKPGGHRLALMNLAIAIAGLITGLSACVYLPARDANPSTDVVNVPSQDWQEEFDLPNRKFTHTGEARYFILKPGFQMIFASKNAKLIITVLDETEEINGITTRVVEEREEINGELYEVSRNFYTMDQATGDVFYFGEDVDFYSHGEIVGHSGAWTAYQNGNKPGLIMPGTPVVGMKYYQELAPRVAMDRARVVSVSETFTTAIGEFDNCLLTQESSKIDPTAIEYKTYCPGIGLVQDQALILVSYGY